MPIKFLFNTSGNCFWSERSGPRESSITGSRREHWDGRLRDAARLGSLQGVAGRSPMRPIRVAEDIVPLSELEGHASEVVEGLRARGRPTVITQGGKAAAVLISPEEFDRLSYEAHVVAAIEQGLADADAGRVVDDEDLDAVLASRIGNLAG